ncbi:MAG: cyclodeaminase/cyclohydrolase family protein [Chloroflexi bacterium]|nr:cyclodeaminase/cyclohydrolase family protein [Chloroflexota bacterium]
MADSITGISFRELTLGQFVDAVASAAPVPGGGSASAVAASIGAALVTMVAALSEGRPKYAAHAALHEQSQTAGHRLAAQLLELADEDAEAYAQFAAAMKMPKDADDEGKARKAALTTAARRAAEVPLRTVEACLEVVATAENLVGRSNINASSDLDVATLLAEAAARGAAANVLINLPSVDDDSYSGEATARVMALLASVEEIVATVHAGVRSGDARDPLETAPG